MEKYGFVYIWYDCKHKRYYIGSHWGTEDDGYICSSNWMKQAYNIRSKDFSRRILATNIECKKKMTETEHYWLQLINEEELGKRYYNLRNHRFGHWTHESKRKQLTVKQKISETLTGRKLSEEHKEKISKANKGQKLTEQQYQNLLNGWAKRSPPDKRPKKCPYEKGTPEYKKWRSEITSKALLNMDPKKKEEMLAKRSKKLKGKKLSEEMKRKISKGLMGHKVSEETKQKISQTKKKQKENQNV